MYDYEYIIQLMHGSWDAESLQKKTETCLLTRHYAVVMLVTVVLNYSTAPSLRINLAQKWTRSTESSISLQIDTFPNVTSLCIPHKMYARYKINFVEKFEIQINQIFEYIFFLIRKSSFQINFDKERSLSMSRRNWKDDNLHGNHRLVRTKHISCKNRFSQW